VTTRCFDFYGMSFASPNDHGASRIRASYAQQFCGAEAIPISAFHFGSGYTTIGKRRYVFHWNRDKFPAPEQLMAKFKAAGMRVVANLKPCLLDDHPRFAEVAATGGFVKDRTSGAPALSQFWDGEGAHLDFSNKAAIAWWQKGLRVQCWPPASTAPGTTTTNTSCGTRMRFAMDSDVLSRSISPGRFRRCS